MTAQHPEICRFSEEEVKAKATDRRGGNQNLFHIPLPFPRKGQLVPGPRLSYWGPSSLLSLYGGRENDGSRVVRRKRESDGRLQKPPWRWVTVRGTSRLGHLLETGVPLRSQASQEGPKRARCFQSAGHTKASTLALNPVTPRNYKSCVCPPGSLHYHEELGKEVTHSK
ncbi:uncharacterized protein isoform X7 [Macaca fascicularis]|uniref:uncharacterized protein isoform X7 n=1 Tax=Macaca fascicularis TaxID=9541 RepID=UPI0032B03848